MQAARRLAAASAVLHLGTIALLLVVHGRLAFLEASLHTGKAIKGAGGRPSRRLHQVRGRRRLRHAVEWCKLQNHRPMLSGCMHVFAQLLPRRWLRAAAAGGHCCCDQPGCNTHVHALDRPSSLLQDAEPRRGRQLLALDGTFDVRRGPGGGCRLADSCLACIVLRPSS